MRSRALAMRRRADGRGRADGMDRRLGMEGAVGQPVTRAPDACAGRGSLPFPPVPRVLAGWVEGRVKWIGPSRSPACGARGMGEGW